MACLKAASMSSQRPSEPKNCVLIRLRCEIALWRIAYANLWRSAGKETSARVHDRKNSRVLQKPIYFASECARRDLRWIIWARSGARSSPMRDSHQVAETPSHNAPGTTHTAGLARTGTLTVATGSKRTVSR